MADASFFWHDYETFGADARRCRPAQFAGVRTDAQLNEIEAPVMHYCAPAPDFLPDPDSCLITGITPQRCLDQGLAEHAFAQAVHAELARPGTTGVGYNSIRFDDEVSRHLFWRNLIEPYGREWANGCARWDLLDPVRCAWALRPEGIEWPLLEGRPSFRLEALAAANGLAHDAAHDALSDVRATLALARLLRARQPRLYEFCLGLRRKDAVLDQIGSGRPFLHISGMYGAQRGFMAAVWPLAPHPTNRNELIVWDLAHDPSELLDLDPEAIRARLFVRQDELAEGQTRVPVKTVHLNRAPVVIGKLETLSEERAAHWGLDLGAVREHASRAARHAAELAAPWAEVYARPGEREREDVDTALYDGLVRDPDRRRLDELRALTPEALAARVHAGRVHFDDARLPELLFRYRARNFAQTLDADEAAQWRAHCAARLHQGAPGTLALAAWQDRVDTLSESADERGLEVLEALVDYVTQIVPED
ncbi:MAG TPA: exodeoxyribonuclease I [Burkholderiaceae bacterium]|nr:exodeoxyribonuclease I [Burkholderiaceae bacterium]